jgi:hypothetical protein
VFKSFLFYLGFFLIFVLFSEELKSVLKRCRDLTERHPRLKCLFYPLAILLGLGAAILIAHSVITLFTSIKFAYD